ncbi:hypothetical protein Aoki45_25500 [Algoriphagus sp. oki45]|nr:hypothetical protein Aoki45_25500 [Algoriphagus sp. oki45]
MKNLLFVYYIIFKFWNLLFFGIRGMEFRTVATLFLFLILNITCLAAHFGLRVGFYRNYWIPAILVSVLALIIFLFDKYQVHKVIMDRFEGISQRRYIVFVLLTLIYMVFSIHFFIKLL